MFAHLVRALRGWRASHSTADVLAGLSDSQLDDIGVRRGEIRLVTDRFRGPSFVRRPDPIARHGL